MCANYQRIIEAVDVLGLGSEGAVEVHKQLGDGPTNETWLVSHNQKRYVLRMLKPLASDLELSLANEISLVTAAAKENLAPSIVASCIPRGIVLSEFVAGRMWTVKDLQDKAQLDRLAKTLNRLHKLNGVAPPLDLRVTMGRYAKRSTDPLAQKWLASALTRLDTITPRAPTLCHNDLNVANIIDDGRLIVIDWEYAALGDPLFDLAVVVAHHEMDAAATKHFLSAYTGRYDKDVYADLTGWCWVYKDLLSLWKSIVDADGR